MTFTHFPVEFTKRGRIFDPTQVDALLAGLSACTDLFVVSHGWNNDVEDAMTSCFKVCHRCWEPM
jgi:hypothetical protein